MKFLKELNTYLSEPRIRADIGIPIALIVGMTFGILTS